MKYKKIFQSLFFLAIIVSPVLAWAVDEATPVDQIITNPLKTESITQLLALVLDIIVQVGLVVVVFMIIFAGFRFVTAQGDTGKITEARKTLVATLIGAAIILGCYAIASALKNTVEQLKTGVVTISDYQNRYY